MRYAGWVDEIARLIGDRYQVESKLGSGGFGSTYAAIDKKTGQKVAVKVLDLHRVSDWKAIELFEREAKVLRTLDHPGIPAYFDFRTRQDDRQAYLIQALAPGENLESLLSKRRFTETDLIDLTRRVLHILDYLTRLHPVVVHRDIKPANILLDEQGKVSLVDFGAVRDVASASAVGGSTVAGTFGYMAPEQLHGGAEPSSDLYGLGMTLIHLATGQEPSSFDSKRLKPDFRKHVHLSDPLEELIDKLIEPVPDDRFQTAAEVLEALDQLGDEASKPLPSSTTIAQARESADRAKVRALVGKAPAPVEKARQKGGQRIDFTTSDDVADLLIRPSRFWRDREVHVGLLLFLVGPLATAALGGLWGGIGAGVAIVLTLLVTLLLWLFAPTYHLRMTEAGDFIYFARNPERPKWIGRVRDLRIETVRTVKGDHVGNLTHVPASGESAGRYFYPLSSADHRALTSAARWVERAARPG